jgi:hypothetical protein
MKRFIAGVGLAAAIVGGAHSAEAVGAQERDVCAPVYDETNGGLLDNSSALRQQIGAYATGGIEVTVQIYRDGTIGSEEELYEQTDTLYDECGWQGAAGDRHVNFAVVVEPGADNDMYDVVIGEIPGRQISDSILDAADAQFDVDSDDPGNSTQDDIAGYLRTINPFTETEPVAVQPELPINEINPETGDNKPMDIPVLPIAGISSVVVAGSLITTRILRGRRIGTLSKSALEAAQLASHRSDEAIDGPIENMTGGAQDILSILKEGDAPELVLSKAELESAINDLRTSKQHLETARGEQRGKLWPDQSSVKAAADTVKLDAARVSELATTVSALTDEVSQQMASLETSLPAAMLAIDELSSTITAQIAEGWDLPEYQTRIGELTAAHTRATELKADNYITEPSDIIATINVDIQSMLAEIEMLETRHDTLATTYKAQTSPMRQLPKLAQSSLEKLSRATEQFGATNFQDLDPTQGFSEAVAELRAAYRAIQPLTKTKSLQAITQGEENIKQFELATARINQLSSDVEQRIASVTKLADVLPVVYEELEEWLGEVMEDLEEFGDKTTDETRTLIIELGAEITSGNQEVKTEKPNLHSLSQRHEKQRDQLEALAAKARAEAVEMGELYANVLTIPVANASALETLELSVKEDDDISHQTRKAIQALELPNIVPGETRQELRQQAELAEDYARRIAELKDLASTERRNAQEERERAAEARRQARQAEQAAEEARRNRRASIPSLTRIGSSRPSKSSSSSGGSKRRSSGSSRPKASGGGAKRRGGRA